MLSNNHKDRFIFIYLIGLGIILRLILALINAYPFDFWCFSQWTNRILSLNNIFDWSGLYLNPPAGTQYPVLPIALYSYGLVGWLGKIIFGTNLFNSVFVHQIIIKLPAILADLLISLFIYKIIKSKFSSHRGIIAAIIFLLNPAVFFVSSLWGQIDSLGFLLILVSLYFLSKTKYRRSWIFLGLAVLTKLQSVIFLPLILFLNVKNDGVKKTSINIILTGLIIFAALLPFNQAIIKIPFILGSGAGFYAYLSLLAFNFWHIVQWRWQQVNLIRENDLYLIISLILFTVSYYLIIKKLSQKQNSFNLFFAAMLIGFSAFMFLTEMHERYLFPAVALLVILTAYQKKYLINYIILSVCYLLNLIFAITQPLTLYRWSLFIAILNLLNFIYLFYKFYGQKNSLSPADAKRREVAG